MTEALSAIDEGDRAGGVGRSVAWLFALLFFAVGLGAPCLLIGRLITHYASLGILLERVEVYRQKSLILILCLQGLPLLGVVFLALLLMGGFSRRSLPTRITALAGALVAAVGFFPVNIFHWYLGLKVLLDFYRASGAPMCGTPFVGFLALHGVAFFWLPFGYLIGWGAAALLRRLIPA